MQLTKKNRVYIIGESSGETATSPTSQNIKEHCAVITNNNLQHSPSTRLALPGDDKQSRFIASCHYQAALIGRLFFMYLIVKFITINTEERL
jgi:hypothetical protein